MDNAYYKFTDEDFANIKTTEDIKSILTGKVMTCSQCCAQRVVVHRFIEQGKNYYSVACGGTYGGDGCEHNICGNNLANIINKWNAEIDEELNKGHEPDYATKIEVY